VDDRGSVAFVNGARLDAFVRFYLVRNNARQFVRAWHGHQRESKLVSVVAGTALICCVKIDDWDNPSPDLRVERFVLSADKPAVLSIPAGFANGSLTLRDDTTICYFSDAAIEEAGSDDFRFPARMWDPWHVVER
jgi:dTDP-4-dehydrorhamnose 3,5-epimerase